MALPQIGAYTFNALSGGFQVAGQSVQDITRPNVDGHAFRFFGKRAFQGVFTSHADVASSAAAKTEIENYQALRGTLVTVIDGIGRTWTNVIVRGVRERRAFRVINSAGGLGSGGERWVVIADWQLHSTEVP